MTQPQIDLQRVSSISHNRHKIRGGPPATGTKSRRIIQLDSDQEEFDIVVHAFNVANSYIFQYIQDVNFSVCPLPRKYELSFGWPVHKQNNSV